MLDIKNYKEDEINFKEYNSSDLVFYKEKNIQFYLSIFILSPLLKAIFKK